MQMQAPVPVLATVPVQVQVDVWLQVRTGRSSNERKPLRAKAVEAMARPKQVQRRSEPVLGQAACVPPAIPPLHSHARGSSAQRAGGAMAMKAVAPTVAAAAERGVPTSVTMAKASDTRIGVGALRRDRA
jgi:hypothetical protein